jgi:enterochelin esterase-like enzyme
LQSSDDQWDTIGIDEAADELIREQEIAPFIIVMPWHRTGIDLEATLVNVLIPYVDQVYATDPRRLSRSIGGVSRGGGWALRMGLRYPGLFSAIGLHSPAIFYNNAYIKYWIEHIPTGLTPRIWIDMGLEDPLYEAVRDLTDFFRELNISYTQSISNGDHTMEYWSTHAKAYVRWYASGW